MKDSRERLNSLLVRLYAVAEDRNPKELRSINGEFEIVLTEEFGKAPWNSEEAKRYDLVRQYCMAPAYGVGDWNACLKDARERLKNFGIAA